MPGEINTPTDEMDNFHPATTIPGDRPDDFQPEMPDPAEVSAFSSQHPEMSQEEVIMALRGMDAEK